MCAIVKPGQIPNQPDASDRPPAHELNQTVCRVCTRSNHHGPAGELAIVECEKKAGTPVRVRLSLNTQRKRTPAETGKANENCQLVTQFAPTTESAQAQGCHI